MADKKIISQKISTDDIGNCIYTIRGIQVMLDSDLAELYQVETKGLNQAVKRNMERFPERFVFQLNSEEFSNSRSQFVTSNSEIRGGRHYLPYAFTEQGVAMLSALLHSDAGAKTFELSIIEDEKPLKEVLKRLIYEN